MTDDYRQYIGVIPLKGKIENVYGVKNTEPTNKELQMINNLLRGGMKGDEFRYGHIVIMTDQDHDGSHIKGLAINAIVKYWPWFVQNNRVKQFVTPLVKVQMKKQLYNFYSEQDFK